MPRIPAFVGPSYRSQSITAACDRTINMYAESLEDSGEIKANAALYPTPGLETFVILPEGPVTQLFHLNGRCFAVAGTGLYELFGNQTYLLRGVMTAGATMPTMCSNGTAGGQLFIVSGLNGYILTLATNAFVQITDPNFPTGQAAMGRFVDSYFAVLKQGTTEWRVSTLLNGLVWPGADVAQRSFAADSIVNLAVTHREVWLLGSQTSEVWYNSGATFPFQPITGVFLQEGCGAVDSVVNMDGSLTWLSENVNGARRILRAAGGYQPQRISTHAIEFALQGYDTVADARAYSYQDQGHSFYVLTIPSQRAGWVYDSTTGLWHERMAWDAVAGDYIAQRPQCHCYAFGDHLVGDRVTGAVFRQDIRFTSDGGGLIRRQRTMVHLTDELRWSFYDFAQIDLETGVATATAPLPAVQDYTVPGSYTFTAPEDGTVTVEAIGAGGGVRSDANGIGPAANARAGGGGGAYGRVTLAVTKDATYAVVVGLGGVSAVTQGANGGASSFGALVTAPGGGGATVTVGGAGGVVGIGDVTFAGAAGGAGGCGFASVSGGGGGAGGATGAGTVGQACGFTGNGGAGNSPGGAGGQGGSGSAAGQGGLPYGGGAGGSGSGASSGSAGGNGLVRITYTSVERTPEVMLRYSNDGGRTWSAERLVSAGRQGEYHVRVMWTRLGRGRDRVFEIAMSDPIPWRLSNMYLRVRSGDS